MSERRRVDDCPCERGGDRARCPCCGYLTLAVNGGSAEYEICEVCGWQHDHVDEARPDEPPLGPNRVSLSQARANFAAFGAAEERFLPHVRPARPGDA